MFVSFESYRFWLQMFLFSVWNYVFEYAIIFIRVPKQVIFKYMTGHGRRYFILK